MKFKQNLICFLSAFLILLIVGSVSYNNREKLYINNENIDKRVISFFQKDYEDVLPVLKECYTEDCDLVVEVEATGENQYVDGYLFQEIEYVKAIKGEVDESKLHTKKYLVGNGWTEGDRATSMGYVNYMKKGEHYIVFLNTIVDDYNNNSSVFAVNCDYIGLRYLNISTDYSYVCNEKGTQTEYKNVKNSEFFVNNEDTLKKLEDYKHEVLKDLNVKTYY